MRTIAFLALAMIGCSSSGGEASTSEGASTASRADVPHQGRPCLPESESVADPAVPGYDVDALHAPCGPGLACSEFFETRAFYCQKPGELPKGFTCDGANVDPAQVSRTCADGLACKQFYGADSTDHLHWTCEDP